MILDYFDIRCGLLRVAHDQTVLQISGLVLLMSCTTGEVSFKGGKPDEVRVKGCLLIFPPKSSS